LATRGANSAAASHVVGNAVDGRDFDFEADPGNDTTTMGHFIAATAATGALAT
jgi:hypothetical protein